MELWWTTMGNTNNNIPGKKTTEICLFPDEDSLIEIEKYCLPNFLFWAQKQIQKAATIPFRSFFILTVKFSKNRYLCKNTKPHYIFFSITKFT